MPIVLDKNLIILSLFKGSGKGQPRKINDFLIVTLLQPNIKKKKLNYSHIQQKQNGKPGLPLLPGSTEAPKGSTQAVISEG